MSWLKPDNIPPSDYDPQKRLDRMAEQYGPLSRRVLDAFNQVDPLRCFFGNNIDEYVGYVERFFKHLAGRDFNLLTDPEVDELVRASFHLSQIEESFADPDDINALVIKIKGCRENK